MREPDAPSLSKVIELHYKGDRLMSSANTTSWSLIRGAADGNSNDRESFAVRYQPVVKAYFVARWKGIVIANDLDDAIQDVFSECFRQGGALARVESGRPGGFRAFFFGVVKNVAHRYEAREARRPKSLTEDSNSDQVHMNAAGRTRELETNDTPDSVFALEWARAVMKQAKAVQQEKANRLGGAAIERFKLLELRFEQGWPIREIAKLWGQDPAKLHHQYAKAREEFHNALKQVVSGHLGNSNGPIDDECRQLLSVLSGDPPS